MPRIPDGDGSDLTYEEVLEFMKSSDWPVTSTEIAAHFDITQQAAYYRLDTLRERGDVESKKANRTVMWRPVD